MDTLRLVIGLDVFNWCPWGKKAFDCLRQFIIDFKKWTPKKQVYQIREFFHIYKFLVWRYSLALLSSAPLRI